MKAKPDFGRKCVCAVFAIAAGTLVCRGQPNRGPSVQLDNYTINRPIYYEAVGNPAAGPDFYVEILGGPDANHLQPIARAPTDTVTFIV